ncbi:MAG TPA: M28 family peptidase [Vicinamibacterales bacterium]|nr:M28 family peptidase [Vicinamibacterales bacterium]
MRELMIGVFMLTALAAVTGVASRATQAPPSSAAEPHTTVLAVPATNLEDALLEWPLSPGEQAYRKIDGKHLHRYVEEQAAISRRYRDQGHPKFWGRIIGSSADAENAEWLANIFKALGMSDVRIQPLDLGPQWFPQKWDVTVTGAGQTITLDSAQPDYRAAALPPGGIDVEAVYGGLGSEADLAGKDVKGKAVFTYTMPGMHNENAVKRADDRAAVAIFEVDMTPGNMRYQAYPSNTKATAFTVGSDDGFAVRDLIASLPPGQSAHVKATLDVEMVPNLKTALVWGTLPGATDETIYVVAHRDGWFEASGDNAGGVAAMIGLAEYYSRIPRAQRRRTMVFIGLDGHHNTGPGSAVGGVWLNDPANKAKLFAKTALSINCEHPSTIQTYVRPRYITGDGLHWSNMYMAQQWYAGGSSRPELTAIAVKAFREFGVPLLTEPDPRPPAGDLGRLYRFTPGVATSEFFHYFHTDRESPATVPWTGLQATTRAYAKIIDDVNQQPLSTFQRPEEPVPTAAR